MDYERTSECENGRGKDLRVEVGESLKRLFEFSGCQLKRSEGRNGSGEIEREVEFEAPHS